MKTSTIKIRKTLTSMLNMFERQMNLGYHAKTIDVVTTISRLRSRLDFIKDASIISHYRFIIKESCALQMMMPGAFSRFKNQRKEVCKLLLEAKLKCTEIIPLQQIIS